MSILQFKKDIEFFLKKTRPHFSILTCVFAFLCSMLFLSCTNLAENFLYEKQIEQKDFYEEETDEVELKILFTNESQSLRENEQKNGARAIYPKAKAYDTYDFYLFYQNKWNESSKGIKKVAVSTHDLGNSFNTTTTFPRGYYDFILYAVPEQTEQNNSSTIPSKDDLEISAAFKSSIFVDLTQTNCVAFRLKPNENINGKGKVKIKVQKGEQKENSVPFTDCTFSAGLYKIENSGKVCETGIEKELKTFSNEGVSFVEFFDSSDDNSLASGEYLFVITCKCTKKIKNYNVENGPVLEDKEVTLKYSEKVTVLMNQTTEGAITFPSLLLVNDKIDSEPENSTNS